MGRPRVRVYTDYKSPFAYIANKRLFEIEDGMGVELNGGPTRCAFPNSWAPWKSARRTSGARCAIPTWTRGGSPMRRG